MSPPFIAGDNLAISSRTWSMPELLLPSLSVTEWCLSWSRDVEVTAPPPHITAVSSVVPLSRSRCIILPNAFSRFATVQILFITAGWTLESGSIVPCILSVPFRLWSSTKNRPGGCSFSISLTICIAIARLTFFLFVFANICLCESTNNRNCWLPGWELMTFPFPSSTSCMRCIGENVRLRSWWNY